MLPEGSTPNFSEHITDTSLNIGTIGEFKEGFAEGVMYDLSGSGGISGSGFLIFNTIHAFLGLDTPQMLLLENISNLKKNLNFDLVK